MLTLQRCISTACIWEATARKAGNVHRFRDFADLSYVDFLLSAAETARVLGQPDTRRVGRLVHDAIQATREIAATNVNLGIVLLLAPLVVVPRDVSLRQGIDRILSDLDLDDSRHVFQAIRLANPGGLGQISHQDVNSEPTLPLREIMGLASARDQIARQYTLGFRDVLDHGVSALQRGLERTRSMEAAIISCHLYFLATFPDSLIARKRGWPEAEEASRRARSIMSLDWPASVESRHAFAEFDRWLREEGHERNPGASADLVAASLFAALREGIITLPAVFPWTASAFPHE